MWSTTIASAAAAWAAKCVFAHDTNKVYGENLHAGTGIWNQTRGVDRWYGEVSGRPPTSCRLDRRQLDGWMG